MPKEGVDKMEHEVNDFHSKRIDSPPKRPVTVCSLELNLCMYQ